jgi:membrane associated rhomboid family serine protease
MPFSAPFQKSVQHRPTCPYTKIAQKRLRQYGARKPMDMNYILFLIAVLNLAGDLYSILKFRSRLPQWIPVVNVIALAACGLAWFVAADSAGFIALGILVIYICSIKLYARSRSTTAPLSAPVTKAIIALNVAAFGVQFLYNATDNPRGFIALGALYTPLLLDQGQWWRLVTAQFLHWGLLHLLFNMMGLWFLGPLAENLLGIMRFAAAYVVCGMGGMAIALGLGQLFYPNDHILMLGASASVLGMVGLQAAIALKALRRSGSLFAKAQLAAMTQIVVLQAVFDFMVPEVSSTAHLGGAAVGFLLGMILKLKT